MKKEKIIISFAALIIGIIVALILFYLYESTKKIAPSTVQKIIVTTPTPTPSVFLTIDNPSDGEVVDKKILAISGKTIPDAKIVISTQTTDVAAVASSTGSFSTEITLSEGENILGISVYSPNGESVKVMRIITYSTESF